MKVPFSILAAAATGAALALPGTVLAQQQAEAAQAQSSAEGNVYECLFKTSKCTDPKPDAVGDGVIQVADRGSVWSAPKQSVGKPVAPKPAVAPSTVGAVRQKVKPKALQGDSGQRGAVKAVVAPDDVARRADVFVTFRSGSAELEGGLPPSIRQLADAMNRAISEGSKPIAQINGHTDAVGDEAFNLKLSQDRAQAVRDKLVELGVPAEAVKSVGYGESKPIEGYAGTHGINRRVEVVVLN